MMPLSLASLHALWSGPVDWWSVGLAILGIIAAWWALRGRRTDRLHCGKCLHALAQTRPDAIAAGALCPECGHSLSVAGGLRQTLPRPYIKWFGRILICSGVAFWLWNGAFEGFGRLLLPRYRVENTQTILGCQVVVSQPRWSDDLASPLVEVRQSGRVVFASTMSHPSVGSARLQDPFCEEPVTLLWVRSDSGGSLGLSETYAFRIGGGDAPLPDFLPFAVLHEGAFIKSTPEQAEPDIWIAYDLTYKYWLTTGVNSPSVALRGTPTSSKIVWSDADPSAAPDEVRLQGVRAKLRTLAAASETDAFAGSKSDEALGLVLDAFLELVYEGRSNEAWHFLRASYNDGLESLTISSQRAEVPRSLEALERVLLEQMQRSPYLGEILRRNGGSIAPPALPTTVPIQVPSNSRATSR